MQITYQQQQCSADIFQDKGEKVAWEEQKGRISEVTQVVAAVVRGVQ